MNHSYRPEICRRGQCDIRWKSTNLDFWVLDEPWEFVAVCQDHAVIVDKTARWAAIKAEQQDLSFGRAAAARIIPEVPEEQIGFSFDRNRNIKLRVPVGARSRLAQNRVAINAELARVSTRLDIE